MIAAVLLLAGACAVVTAAGLFAWQAGLLAVGLLLLLAGIDLRR